MGRTNRTIPIALASLIALALTACAGDDPGQRFEERRRHGHGHHHGHGSGQERHVQHGHGEERSAHVQHDFEGAEEWAKRFDDPARDAWQQPDAVIERLALEPGSLVADIGSGTGYFAVRIARALPEGQVYGIDTEPDMVRYLNERATREGVAANLTSQQGEPGDPRLPEAVDLVLMVNTYHHISGRIDYFQRLKMYLRPSGRVAIVDFKPGDLPVGPPAEGKIPTDEINPDTHYLGNRPRPVGVVEKCTFCIQRVRDGRYPACVEICPVGARKFGNLLDENDEIRVLMREKRVFVLKEELNTQPKFYYFYAT